MKDGDLMVSIDGESMKGAEMQTIIRLLRGQEGVLVMLDVRQPHKKVVRALAFKRGVVPQVVIEGWTEKTPPNWDYLVADDMAYLKFLEINSSTVHDLKRIERYAGVTGE